MQTQEGKETSYGESPQHYSSNATAWKSLKVGRRKTCRAGTALPHLIKELDLLLHLLPQVCVDQSLQLWVALRDGPAVGALQRYPTHLVSNSEGY